MKIALVGNQNSGKTTLFNLLTDSNQKIGNWPGVTVEKKSGKIKKTNDELIDLPGIYSLSPYSLEEEISRKFILDESPDLIINIIDATNIERSLYLTTQLLELDIPVIIALNMTDILKKKGVEIDATKLSEKLNTTVCEISALKKINIDKLISLISNKDYLPSRNQRIFTADLESAIVTIEKTLTLKRHKRFISVKLLENDKHFESLNNQVIKSQSVIISNINNMDTEQIIANERYNYIKTVKDYCFTKKEVSESISDKLDKVFLNKYLAIPIFVVIMFLIYMLAVGVVGSATVGLMEGLFELISEGVSSSFENANVSGWLSSLVVDGIIAGVGAVLTFVPQLIILFICIVLLETTGYMNRVAFMLDRLFKKFGLSGKTLIPFIVGTGCAVPGVMATRTIENHEEREMAVVLTPFVPCSAKLPIIALFAGFFFEKNSGLVSASLYFLSIIIILLWAVLLKKFIYKKGNTTFISELPEYKAPSVTYVLKDVFDKVMGFIKRAGSIILITSIAVWFLSSFSFRFEFGVDIEDSMLAKIGNLISWLFYPMLGELSWGATVSAVLGLAAKEGVVTSMEVIAQVSEGNTQGLFTSGIFGFFNGASAYAFMAFNLFSAPCFGALGAMKRELGGTKKMLKAALFQTGFAFLIAYFIFLIGSIFI